MERLTREADFGLEDWEETLFFVKSDPNGAYDIIDIARHQGESEFDEILKNISLRLAALENILGDNYDFYRLREMVQADREGRYIIMRDAERNGVARLKELSEADREGRCVVLPVKEGDTVYHITWNPFEDDPPEIFDCAFHITDYYAIGNTVFLTEEDAEKAIEKMKERENDG